ncbi:hypothetical protein IFT59_22025 [Rhizobium sp. CFBP 8752]|uniref:hypothetical protein n=1 Tax=Rhizobium sp. CFBP 8752 TaxID=2775301 RepID=UPI0017876A11|nr:hypothetical protein [Rhizobium sp. CFBP 8752]MBD8665923.1 hypothetical protein [Rhizobium sp. CFBP 8752]
MYRVMLDGLHLPQHAVFHAKVTVVLQEHKTVAGGKAAQTVIGLEGELATLLTVIRAANE